MRFSDVLHALNSIRTTYRLSKSPLPKITSHRVQFLFEKQKYERSLKTIEKITKLLDSIEKYHGEESLKWIVTFLVNSGISSELIHSCLEKINKENHIVPLYSAAKTFYEKISPLCELAYLLEKRGNAHEHALKLSTLFTRTSQLFNYLLGFENQTYSNHLMYEACSYGIDASDPESIKRWRVIANKKSRLLNPVFQALLPHTLALESMELIGQGSSVNRDEVYRLECRLAWLPKHSDTLEEQLAINARRSAFNLQLAEVAKGFSLEEASVTLMEAFYEYYYTHYNEETVDYNLLDNTGANILHHAITDSTNLQKMLTDIPLAQRLAAVTMQNKLKQSLLHLAVQHIDSLRMILLALPKHQRRAALEQRDLNGHRVIDLLLEHSKALRISLELCHQADRLDLFTCRNQDDQYYLFTIADKHESLLEIFSLLTKAQIILALQLTDNNGLTLLHHACKSYQSLAIILSFIESLDLIHLIKSIPPKNGCNLLHYAVHYPRALNTILMKLPESERSALLSLYQPYEKTKKHTRTSSSGSSGVFSGKTSSALIQPSSSDMIVDLLMSNNLEGISVTLKTRPHLLNIQDIFGNTPLMLAINLDLYDIALLLVKAGANISIKNNEGHSASDLARSKEWEQLLVLIESEDNKPDTQLGSV